jgi:SRSO17 transposase
VAACHSVDLDRWQRGFDELVERIACRFVRVEPRRRVRLFMLGLLAGLPRVNCWTIAEHAGEASPDGMQHLLARAAWDADAVRDDLRGYVVDHLADPGAVLVVDETGDLKKGVHTVGVQRQYTGTAGRIENAQVGVYLVYAATGGHAFIDRALYLPKSWTTEPDRCRAAGIPDDIKFATKPALTREMIIRALDAGVPASWVAGDEVYGGDSKLRAGLQERRIGYVLGGGLRPPGGHAGRQTPCQGSGRLPARAWNRLSAGAGAKGHRWYDWALIDIPVDVTDAEVPGSVGDQALLVRRSISTGELAFYRCYTPVPAPLAALVAVAGRRWTIEESFQAGKGLTGLDEHQVRRWISWHRWTILAMLAHAFLAVTAATARAQTQPTPGLITLTANEIRHLFTRLLDHTRHSAAHLLHWSRWRRRHQARARDCHHRRQTAQLA